MQSELQEQIIDVLDIIKREKKYSNYKQCAFS